MNKKSVLYVLLDLVFLVVFNTIFFVIGGTDHPVSVWISYAFIHFAYIMVLATAALSGKSSNRAIFGFALGSVSAVYFLVEFVVGLIFVLLRSEQYKAALVVQILIAGVYAILLLSNLIANEHTAEAVEQHEKEVLYIKDAASRVKLLVGRSADKNVNKELERLYDLLHASPTKSHTSVEVLEANIKSMISELEAATANDNLDLILQLTNKIASSAEERNRRLKML